MKKLENKVAVITGGNSGIGFATAKEFIREGAKLIITGRNPSLVEDAANTLGNGTRGIVADQAKVTDIEQLVRNVKATYASIDTLFINAGVATMASIEGLTEEQFDNMMDVNFKGAYFTLQKFLPLLKEGSSVIMLSSVNAYSGMPNTAVYGASKAAMNSLTRTASYELAGRKIRVNAVCPGPVATPLFSKVGVPEEAIQEFGKAMAQRVPLKQFGQPEQIAKLVTFLASDDASFITGSEYVIDGGVIVNPILG